MNIYKLSQTTNIDGAYDSCVVFALDIKAAKKIHPDGEHIWKKGRWENIVLKRELFPNSYTAHKTWCNPQSIKVEFIGHTSKQSNVEKHTNMVVCASFGHNL